MYELAYIYKITNILNNKCYIGKTNQANPINRWKSHISESKKDRTKNRPLYKAILKYGIDSFTFEVLEKIDSNLSSMREIELIEIHKSYGSQGYNATRGGDGAKYIDYDLVLAKYEEIQCVIDVAKLLNIHRDSVTNILHSFSIPIKCSQSISKEKTSIKVNQYNLSGDFIRTWDSQSDAARSLSLDKGASGHISACCKGKQKSSYGFIWKYTN